MNKYAKAAIALVVIVIILRNPTLTADIKELIHELLQGIFGNRVNQ